MIDGPVPASRHRKARTSLGWLARKSCLVASAHESTAPILFIPANAHRDRLSYAMERMACWLRRERAPGAIDHLSSLSCLRRSLESLAK